MNGTFDDMCCFEYSEGILHCMQLNCKHSLSVLVRKSNGLSYRFLANSSHYPDTSNLSYNFSIFSYIRSVRFLVQFCDILNSLHDN